MPQPPKTFADVITTSHRSQILASDRVWEQRTLMLSDDVCPQLIAETLKLAVNDLLDEAAHKAVALDWVSTRMHIQTFSTGESTLVTRVGVL